MMHTAYILYRPWIGKVLSVGTSLSLRLFGWKKKKPLFQPLQVLERGVNNYVLNSFRCMHLFSVMLNPSVTQCIQSILYARYRGLQSNGKCGVQEGTTYNIKQTDIATYRLNWPRGWFSEIENWNPKSPTKIHFFSAILK